MKRKKLDFSILAIVLSVSLFFFCPRAFAATYSVSTSADFKNWTTNAQPGDVIIVTPGTYENWGEIKLTADGTESQPITYKANSSGDVIFKDTMVLRVRGDWIILENLNFNGVGSSFPYSAIDIGSASNSRITNCRFYSCGTTLKSWAGNIELLTGAKLCRIDHCLFDNAQSCMIGSDVDCTKDWPKDIQIDHNIFQNSSAYCAIQTASGTTNNGSEETRYIVEYNIFQNLGIGNGSATETICNKSSGNIYRFNTFQDMPSGMLSIRMGYDCKVEGNKFSNCQCGVRITGKRHIIYNNIFYNNVRAFCFTYGAILEYSGQGTKRGGKTGNYVAAKDCIVTYNTAIGLSGQNIMVVNNAGYAPATNNPSDNTIANNIFVSDHDKCIQYDFSDNEINTNIFHSIDSQEVIGVLRSNYILADPNFVGQGINSRLSSISPAIDKAIPIFGFEINIDLDGNARPQGIRNDIGAHEFLQSFQPPQSVEIIK